MYNWQSLIYWLRSDMQRLSKIFGITIGLIVLLFIGAAIALYIFVNTSQFKTFITQQVYAETGRQLTIDGNLKLSFFPWLGVKINNVSLSNAKGFQPTNMASVKEVDAKFKVLPLLSGKVEVGTINLVNLDLSLAKNAQGSTNWDDVIQKLTHKKESSPNIVTTTSPNESSSTKVSHNNSTATPEVTSKTNAKKLPNFQIENVNIVNANVKWDDQQSHQHFAISNFNFSSKKIGFDHSFPINLSLEVKNNAPQTDGKIKLTTNVQINRQDLALTLQNFDLDALLNGKTIPGGKIHAFIKGDLNFNLGQQTFNIPDLSLEAYNMIVRAQFKGVKLLNSPEINGVINVDSFNPRTVLSQLGQHLQFVNENGMRMASANITVNANKQSVNLSKINVTLDKSKLNGFFKLTDFANPNMHFSFDLNNIDLNNYLIKNNAPQSKAQPAPKAMTTSTTAPTSHPAVKSSSQHQAAILPVAFLRKISMNGQIQIGKVSIKRYDINNIKFKIVANNGLIKLANSEAKLFAGEYQGSGVLNVQSNTPKLSYQGQLNNIQASQLFVFEKPELGVKQITGTANANISLSTQGNSVKDFTQYLNGLANIAFSNGELEGVDVGYQLSRAQNQVFALLNKPSPNANTVNTGKTKFLSMKANMNIKNGIATTNGEIVTPLFTGRINGPINLVTQQFLNVDISALLTGIKSNSPYVQAFANTAIPYRLSGSFSKPEWHFDSRQLMQNIVHSQQKNIQKKITQKVETKVKQLVNQKLGNKLNSIFDRF